MRGFCLISGLGGDTNRSVGCIFMERDLKRLWDTLLRGGLHVPKDGKATVNTCKEPGRADTYRL